MHYMCQGAYTCFLSVVGKLDVMLFHCHVQAKEMPLQELVALLHLFLSPATDPMQQEYQQHSTKLHSQAAALVTAAEKAFADHGNSHSSAAPDTALQDKITKAAYAAAAVVGFTAQVSAFPNPLSFAYPSVSMASVNPRLC